MTKKRNVYFRDIYDIENLALDMAADTNLTPLEAKTVILLMLKKIEAAIVDRKIVILNFFEIERFIKLQYKKSDDPESDYEYEEDHKYFCKFKLKKQFQKKLDSLPFDDIVFEDEIKSQRKQFMKSLRGTKC